MPDLLRLSRAQLEAIVGHARTHTPEEACGILAGTVRDGIRVVQRVFLMENSEHSSTFYMMDSREQFEVFDSMQKDDLQLVAIFHSHPHSPAVPSGVDLELAFYPDSLYLIVSLMNLEPESHAYRIVDGTVTEAGLEVIS
jgi:proteasome lid subunit RPN8/RPN11